MEAAKLATAARIVSLVLGIEGLLQRDARTSWRAICMAKAV
jgi:hypothetical protein